MSINWVTTTPLGTVYWGGCVDLVDRIESLTQTLTSGQIIYCCNDGKILFLENTPSRWSESGDHLLASGDSWCQQVISRLAQPNEGYFRFTRTFTGSNSSTVPQSSVAEDQQVTLNTGMAPIDCPAQQAACPRALARWIKLLWIRTLHRGNCHKWSLGSHNQTSFVCFYSYIIPKLRTGIHN